MITWSISTKPCPIITWDGVVFNGEHHYVDHIYYMIHAWPFGLSVPRPYLHMLGSSSLIWVFRVCNCFAPVVFERRAYHTRSSRGVSARRTFTTVHTQGEHLYLEINKGSSYNTTAVLRKIRRIKDKHHMQSKYVTWYGHHHLVLIISITESSSWSPSSPVRHLDLHRSIVVVSLTIVTTTIANA